MIPSVSYPGTLMQPEKRGERNNNPCNIDYAPENDWQGMVPYSVSRAQDARFCVFYTPLYGIRAAAVLITNIAKRGNTYRDIVSVWAPSTENNTSAYLYFVCKHCAVSETSVFNSADKLAMQNLIAAIIGMENGRVIYPYDLISTAIEMADNV